MRLARSFPPNSSEQFAVVTGLFISNRIYLYALSATIVALAGIRGANDSPRLGQRITDLTEELISRPSLVGVGQQETKQQEPENVDEKPAMIRSISDSGLKDSLDQVSSETQALVLPLLISILLAISVFLVPIWNNIPSTDSATSPEIKELLSKILPNISQLYNIGLVGLFTRQEIRRLGSEVVPNSDLSRSSTALLELGLAVGITCISFATKLWPAQNFSNMALAILVSRAIQLDTFPAVVVALSLLTLYDASSVFLIPSAGAIPAIEHFSGLQDPTSSILLADHASLSSPVEASAMGSVAMQKLTSSTFQPGLLVAKVGDRLGGTLGLGDAVFPSLLATFVRRFDINKQKRGGQEESVSLFSASIGGYILGCLACELAPQISTSGLPALVFIIPIMLGTVILAAYISGEQAVLWKFDPKLGLDNNLLSK